MANTDNNTVQLTVSSESPYIEGIVETGVTATPGELLNLKSTGNYGYATVDGEVVESTFAVENLYTGGDIDTTYAAGSRAMIRSLRKGDIFLAYLAPTNTIAIGDILIATTDGWLTAWTVGTEDAVAVALEAITTTISKSRIKVSIL